MPGLSWLCYLCDLCANIFGALELKSKNKNKGEIS